METVKIGGVEHTMAEVEAAGLAFDPRGWIGSNGNYCRTWHDGSCVYVQTRVGTSKMPAAHPCCLLRSQAEELRDRLTALLQQVKL